MVFGIVGVQVFNGSLLYRCYEVAHYNASGAEQLQSEPRVPTDPVLGVCAPDTYGGQGTCEAGQVCLFYGENPLYGTVGFDNIELAWLTIFQCITMEGWTQVMYMTSRPFPTLAPFYFIALIVMGSFYMLNLFLAVMWHVYQRNREISSRAEVYSVRAVSRRMSAAGGSSRRVSLRSAFAAASLARPRRPAHDVGARRRVASVVESSAFNSIVIGMILLNVAFMMSERYPMTAARTALLEGANLVFTLLFALEMALKLVAYGVSNYWADVWNRFDALVVVASILDLASEFFGLPVNAQARRAVHTVACRHTPPHTAIHRHTPSHTVTHRYAPSRTATHRHTPPHTATYRHRPPHTATHRHLPAAPRCCAPSAYCASSSCCVRGRAFK